MLKNSHVKGIFQSVEIVENVDQRITFIIKK